MRLFIIRNGFDKHYGLDCLYSDYKEFLLENCPEIKNNFERFPYLSITKNNC